ncbi:MAG: queuosine precursor transporter [Hyphomicrobiaceae bacterium]|nr:queuosine precursor transporter [Hyphomicrobiaceae bacterium]
MRARFLVAVLAMVLVVVSSNYLVQFPVQGSIGPVDLSQILTWGAFTYPVAFLVNDLTNRHFGPRWARIVVIVGFVIAVAWSSYVASPRIAIASGSAFLLAQLLDTSIFDFLRRSHWWRAPLISSLIGSVIDTVLFFGVAFSVTFGFVDPWFGSPDGSLGFGVPFLSIGGEVPLWMSLAAGDFIVKMLVALVLLVPYGALRRMISDRFIRQAA